MRTPRRPIVARLVVTGLSLGLALSVGLPAVADDGSPDYSADFAQMAARWKAWLVGDASTNWSDADYAAYRGSIDKGAGDARDKISMDDACDVPLPSFSSADMTAFFKDLRKMALAYAIPGGSLTGDETLAHQTVMGLKCGITTYSFDGDGATDLVRNGNWYEYQIASPKAIVDTLLLLSGTGDSGYEDIKASYAEAIDGYLTLVRNQTGDYYEPKLTQDEEAAWRQGQGLNNPKPQDGANLADMETARLGVAILAEDPEWSLRATELASGTLALATAGNGIYADGSLLYHADGEVKPLAYTGSYGADLLGRLAFIDAVTDGTFAAFGADWTDNLYTWIVDGVLPWLHQGKLMAAVDGRAIARYATLGDTTLVKDYLRYGTLGSEASLGRSMMAGLLAATADAPTAVRDLVQATVKDNLEKLFAYYDSTGGTGGTDSWTSYYVRGAGSFRGLSDLKGLLNNPSVASQPYTGVVVFPAMDRVVQATGQTTTAISLYSSRTSNYECMNEENLKGWHTGDGAVYIYNDDLDQYGEAWWPTVDATHIPGTTEATKTPDACKGNKKASTAGWVGGAASGTAAAVGMVFDKSSTGLSNVTAKKSYFLTPEGYVIALGSGINAPASDGEIDTTVDNRLLSATREGNLITVDQPHTITIGGEVFPAEDCEDSEDAEDDEGDEPSERVEMTCTLKAGSYVHLNTDGSDDASQDIGYVFLEDATVTVSLKVGRSGTYQDINGYHPSDKAYEYEYLAYWFTLTVNHGTGPVDGSYAYAMLPGLTAEQTAAVAAAGEVEFVDTAADVEATAIVYGGTLYANVWGSESTGLGPFVVSGPASVIVEGYDQPGDKELYISDPTQVAEQAEATVTLPTSLVGPGGTRWLSFGWDLGELGTTKQATLAQFDYAGDVTGREAPVVVDVTVRNGDHSANDRWAAVGDVLTAEAAYIAPGGEVLYQWYRGSAAIPGATGSTYQVVEADAGHYLTVKVTAALNGQVSPARYSDYKLVEEPPAIKTVSVAGSPRVGQELKAVVVYTPALADVSFQWLRDGNRIDEATGGTYTVSAADVGHQIGVEATVTSEGSVEEATAKAIPVTGLIPDFRVTIDSSAEVGDKLKAQLTVPLGDSTVKYEWYRGSARIADAWGIGAGFSTYEVVTADAGQDLVLKVTASGTSASGADWQVVKYSNHVIVASLQAGGAPSGAAG
ncbi:MAG: hypothetical protein LBR27_07595 [Bifidobacteriaceae bacterium]|jgi:hyaluronate lyase|nr:hypothetical protein [Bifidobacteriaceae bacterium]